MSPYQSRFFDWFLAYGVPFIVTAFGASIAGLALKAIAYLHQKGKANRLVAALALVAQYAADGVAGIVTQMGPDYRKSVSDGVLTQAEMLNLKTEALNLAKLRLGAAGYAALNVTLDKVGLKADPELQAKIASMIARLSGHDPSAPVVNAS